MVLVSSLVAVASAAPAARASFIGLNYSLTLDNPTIGQIFLGPSTGTVGAGVEVADMFGTSHDIGADTIRIAENPGSNSFYGSAAFAGYHYTFTGAPVITGVSLDPSGIGFVPTVTFDADEIFVNFSGAAVPPGQFSLLNVTFAADPAGGVGAVPLPAAIWPGLLLGSGMVVNRHRRARRPG